MKEIPSFNIELAQATDYILGCPLAKKAFSCPPFNNFTNIVTDIICWIDRLADNCHMPEFTNHALPHICSIVKRASEWGESDGWLKKAKPQEAGYLLIALLIHDIGMLSQDSRDLPEDEKLQNMKGLSDISGWVRRTHVIRIEKLVKKFLENYTKEDPPLSNHLDVIIGMAQSHAKWPWDPDFVTRKEQIASVGLEEDRIGAFNAVIAVCDLLDEDCERCDTITLIKHRYGTITNRAHWIRHALTKQVAGVHNHKIVVQFRSLPSKSPHLEILYRTLRNHYRLVKLYQENLAVIRAQILHLDFEPGDGIPEEKDDEISKELSCYRDIPELRDDVVPQLLATFMKEARNQDNGNKDIRKRLDEIGLETMDLSGLDDFFHPGVLFYPEERVIFGKGNIDQKLAYAHDLAEKAYVNGEMEKLRHICGAAIDILKPHSVKPEQIYWAITYLLIYEKGHMDYDAVERIHKNFLRAIFHHNSNGICEPIPSEEPYQGLLDVLFYFLKPCITSEAFIRYQNYLMEYNYANLRDDFATLQLAQTVVGLFWLWDRQSMAWREISMQIRHQANKSRLSHMLETQQKRLELQYKLLYESDNITEAAFIEMDYPILAKAWKHFFQADWKSVAEDIPQMIECAEKNPDLFGSVQGYQNMTYPTLKWNGMDRNFKAAKYYETGIRRYQRNASEQERSEFCQSRENIIEALLSKNQLEPNSSDASIMRSCSIRLISLRKLEALQYWNIGEYLESVRNEARLFYDLAVYEDKNGTYQGIVEYLPKAIISSIQSMESKRFTEEEMQQLIAKMYYYYPKGYEEVVQFLISCPQKCCWSYGMQWIQYFIIDLNSVQLTQLLKWTVQQYDTFIQLQKQHLNLGEYKFLWQAAYRFTEDDWGVLLPIIRRIYKNYFLYNANRKLARNSLQYMPLPICKEIIEMLENWTFEPLIRNAVYEICIGLSLKHESEINTRLHQFVHKCQVADPCPLYQELDRLIDIDNLLERQDIDIEGICQTAKETIEQLKHTDLSRYDSRFLHELKEKFTNQNWSLMPEEKVLAIIREFLTLLKSDKKISNLYFSDICELLRQISRMSEKNVQKELAVFFVEMYILPGANAKDISRQQNYIDGPLNNIHLDLFGYRKIELDILPVLVSCITEIPENHLQRCTQWILECLGEDNGSLYYYAVLFITYYYFKEKSLNQNTALIGLMYIRGHLEAKGKYFESQLYYVLHACKNLETSDLWFREKTFKQLVEKDIDYQELFQKPIQALMKKSGNSKIRHWNEENGI